MSALVDLELIVFIVILPFDVLLCLLEHNLEGELFIRLEKVNIACRNAGSSFVHQRSVLGNDSIVRKHLGVVLIKVTKRDILVGHIIKVTVKEEMSVVAVVVEQGVTHIADGALVPVEGVKDRVNDEMLVAGGTKGDELILVRGDAAVVDGSDSVVHSCTSFHFTILIDVLLMSYYSFLRFRDEVRVPHSHDYDVWGGF